MLKTITGRTHLSCDGSIRCQAMSWAYWQFMLSNFTTGLEGNGGVARQEFYPGSKQKWKSSCVYIDQIKSVLSVARKPHNGACCDKPHPKNANKEQPVCQQRNLGSDDLNETAKKKKKNHTDQVLDLQLVVNHPPEKPHLLLWRSAPRVSLSALWFLGPLPFNAHREQH